MLVCLFHDQSASARRFLDRVIDLANVPPTKALDHAATQLTAKAIPSRTAPRWALTATVTAGPPDAALGDRPAMLSRIVLNAL
jgi:hypothetical protein